MATIKEYLDYAELAQASYGLKLKEGMFGKDNADYIDELSRKDSSGKINFSQTQAENFADRYTVLATSSEYGIGNISNFDAVLFLDTQTGKKVMAIRGSQEIIDYALDAVLGVSGLIFGQDVSLNNFYDALVADNKLSIVEKIDVTGHSLGGYLAQLFTAEHPYVVDNAYTYNAPGIGGLNQELQELFGLKNPSDYNDKITNLYAEDGSEFVSGLGVMLGEIVPLSIDPSTIGANNHRIGKLTESLHVYNMLSSIANTQDLNLLTSILENTTNEKAISIVSDVFQYEVSGSEVDKAIDLTKKWSGDATGITSLADKTSSQLESKRPENLYALLKLNSFVLEGDYLPAYQTIKVDDYAATYLEKRSEMLYSVMHPESSNTGNGTTYQDISLDITTTDKLLITPATSNEVKFGGDSADNISGYANDDYLFGGNGKDTLNNFSTCKPFTASKALHVENQSKPKEEDNGLYQKVA